MFLLAAPGVAVACPFCNAVSQTLRQEMEVMDAVVIATAMQGDVARNKETGEVLMKVDHVLKGDELCRPGQEVKAVYYGDVTAGRRFMLSGVDPPELQWSCLPLTERSEKYVIQVTELPDDAVARLRFYIQYLQDEESMLARDAYDEFAIAPYKAVKDLGPEMDHAQLVKWIRDPEQSTDRKRLYLTMLGVCGTKKDLPMLEELMRSTQKSTRGGLDALIACYLTLAGEEGLPLVVELFLDNKNAQYADTYAAIMAIRFHGTEGDVIARSALTESLHHVLDRKDLADLVIPDLARWSDWSQIDRMTDLFINADPENNWVRVPVVNYLRACPLPAAKAALEKLEKVDPESVRRANTFFSIPVPAKDTGSSNSAKPRKSLDQFVALPIVSADDHFPHNGGSAQATASTAAATAPVARSAATLEVATANPLQLLGVLAMALATIVIAQFLLLTGGAIPEPSQA
ncbi:MAG: hypothetical protein HKN47_00720 [Pirellulaceae bacterium]|nr:hypothetical protein [Pirellulaceae bacterium]